MLKREYPEPSQPIRKPIFLITTGERSATNTFLEPTNNIMEEEREKKLIKNRKSAVKSRKKKKKMFEALKYDIADLSKERDCAKAQLNDKLSILEMTYKQTESLRMSVDKVIEENSKLKDNIIQMQSLLGQLKHSMQEGMSHQRFEPVKIPQNFTTFMPNLGNTFWNVCMRKQY